ncbi:MAG TPA: hypothetical protein VMU48_05090 [Terracidiphilus sp.]|nr:hypothetical protein [Terracidiphilus sp.]
MPVTPFAGNGKESSTELTQTRPDAANWVRIAACGSLIAGGVLYLTGQRRAGLATAVAGTALVLLDQQEVVQTWWRELPNYVCEVQNLLDDMEKLVEDISLKRRKLHQVPEPVSRATTPAGV